MPIGLSTFSIIKHVLLFLAKLRFLAQDSMIKILPRRYGNDGFKKAQ